MNGLVIGQSAKGININRPCFFQSFQIKTLSMPAVIKADFVNRQFHGGARGVWMKPGVNHCRW
jgi:hypothetical protein